MENYNMDKTPIILIGGGGHCKSVIEVIESKQSFQIIGILDAQKKKGQQLLGYPYLGADDDIPKLTQQCSNFCITVGHIKSATIRKKLFSQVKSLQGKFPILIAATAHVSQHAQLGEGTVVMHHALVNAQASVGSNCIINSGAIVEHDVVIHDHVHISTHATVNGGAKIAQETLIGSKSVILQGCSIPSKSIVGAGAVVTKSFKTQGTFIGIPARQKEHG